MRNIIESKKGEVEAYIIAIAALFIFGILSLISYLMWDEITTALAATGLYVNEAATAGSKFTALFLALDSMVVFFTIILILAVAIYGWYNPKPRIFFVVTFIEGLFLGLVSYVFNIAFNDYATSAVFAGIITAFPNTILFCTNLHWIALVLWAVGAITTYARRGENQDIGTGGFIP